MMKPQFYLFFRGDCHAAMTHYADTLGGTIEGVFLNRDAPATEDRMPGGDALVMNLVLRLGDTLMMASDNSDATYEPPQGFRIQIEAPSLAEFERVFAALADGASAIAMPPGETFWAERFAMFTDRFGTPWMLNFTGSKAQAEGRAP
ncbi:VOC family protein [Rubrimonas cliftonensis]|uniref:PhnB protein n=1 Tax=Rubrimonas cliftonensis TaxID=89524 RepID=A0A1H4D826_9RHOB|nr:VOC family protein [Rubrimonas cliftonensis]SEA68874.1 PhnB protein [Rubrimonas cliftonensis]